MGENMDEEMDEEMNEEKESYDEGKNPKDSGYPEKAKHQAMKNSHYEIEMDETKSMDEELDELLRELDMDEEMDEVINNPKGSGAHGNIAPNSINDTDLNEAKESEEDEEINIEDMSEEDLKSFIEDVIHDMVEAGELEAGHEGMENEPGFEDEEGELDELLKKINKKSSGYSEKAKHQAMKNSHYEKMKEDMDEMKNELNEAYKALEQVKNDLNEVNLLNSKLLYTNKIFKAKNLTNSQKLKVLEAFDKATNKKETKLIYETVIGNLNTTNKSSVTESIKGIASKVITGNIPHTKQPIIEVNSAFARMQQLAGIKKSK
jgi:hypothetical protein